MDESNNKELVEKIISSKYFETLVDEQIRARMGELFRKNKWIIRALVVVIAIISFFLGKDFYDINQQLDRYQARYDEYQTKFDKFQQKADTLIKLQSSFETQLTLLGIQTKNEGEISTKRESINLSYQALLGLKLQDIQNSYQEIKNQIEENKSLKVSMENSIQESKRIKNELDDIYKAQILPNLTLLDERTKLIELTSSIRYLFAERSERTSGESQYRPAVIKLPLSKDILKVVFHKVLSNENPKEIMVDFYLNSNKKAFSQSVFTESDGSYDQKPIEITSSEKNIYEAIPVFIYLPPNVPLVKRIPDVLILKISLTKKNESK